MHFIFRSKLIMQSAIIVVLTVNHCIEVKSANILFVFAGGTYSHEIAIGPLVEALANKGHHVSFLSAFSNKHFLQDNVEIIAPEVLVKNMAKNWGENKFKKRQDNKEKSLWYEFPDWAIGICELLLNEPEDVALKNLFHTNRTFDLLIIDAAINDCGFIMAHYFKAKYIISDSTTVLPWHYDIFSLPEETSSIPLISSHLEYPLTFISRLYNYFEPFYWIYRRNSYFYPQMESIMKKFLKTNTENVPKFIDLERNTSLVFLNTHPSIDLPRSLPPLFVHIGGMQCWDTKKQTVPAEIEKYIDEADKGVVLIVFGTTINLREMPIEILNAFFEVMEIHRDMCFIWKWEGEIPNKFPSNLMMIPWLPLKEVLGNANIKAFITHCGLNSLIEATFHAVPVIGIPLFGDQDFFAYRIEAEQIGVRVELRDITTGILDQAITSVLQNLLYKTNMKKMSAAFRDRPQSPLYTAVYWVEYVLRHDDVSFLRPKNISQSPCMKRSLDIVLFILFTVVSLSISSLGLLFYCVRCFISYSRNFKKTKVE